MSVYLSGSMFVSVFISLRNGSFSGVILPKTADNANLGQLITFFFFFFFFFLKKYVNIFEIGEIYKKLWIP